MKKTMIRILSLILIGAFLPCMAQAAVWDLGNGDITVNATETTQTVSQGNNTQEDKDPVITSNGNSTGNTLTIQAADQATAKVTLDKVNIDVSTEQKAAITTDGKGNVTLNLSGDNSVKSGDHHAGVEKSNTGNLTITAQDGTPGSLTAQGGGNGAGIGGGYLGNGSNITVSGGEVTAKGGADGAGIGGGSEGSGSDITIKDGKVTANGGDYGAGIGGGYFGSGSKITVSGGEVEATGNRGAGIGGGYRGNGSDITIEDGKVTAKGGDWGAGIGGGSEGSGSNVTISGDAQVKVQGGTAYHPYKEGAAIGNGGNRSEKGKDLTPDTSKLTVEGFIQ